MDQELDWVKVGRVGDLPDGRVKTVSARNVQICLAHFDGQWAALDNRCPHQGGPLGEGSIEKGEGGQCWIRCPWHGWDFDPLTGKPPGGHEDSGQALFPLEIRGEEIFVGLEAEVAHERTVTDVMAETMVQWGVKRVFGMVGHSNLGLAEAIRRRVVAGELSHVGIRHEGAAAFAASAYGKLTGKPAACLTIAGPGATNLLTGLWDAKEYGMDITHVLVNNGQLGKISKEQRAGEWPVWETSLHDPSFAAFAKLCGGYGRRVTQAEDLDDALREALEVEGPSLVEIEADAELI